MKKLNFIYQKKLGYLFLSPAIIFILCLFSEIIFASGFMKFVSDLDLIFITSFLTTTSFGSYILGYLDWQKKEDYFYSAVLATLPIFSIFWGLFTLYLLILT